MLWKIISLFASSPFELDLSDDDNDGAEGQSTSMESSDIKIIISKETGLSRVIVMMMMMVLVVMMVVVTVMIAMLMRLTVTGFPSLPRNTWTRNKVRNRRWRYLSSGTEPSEGETPVVHTSSCQMDLQGSVDFTKIIFMIHFNQLVINSSNLKYFKILID